MEIDIINYTQEQLAALSREKIQQIRSAQVQKNRLLAAFVDAVNEERERLMDRGVLLSSVFERRKSVLRAECDRKIERIRESLLFYLQFADNPVNDEEKPSGGAYEVDYSLSIEERVQQVKGYYERTYTNPQERFDVFAADEVAKSYLGELYASLWHYFKDCIPA